MFSEKNKIKQSPGVNFSTSNEDEKPSPHVLDLRKILADKKKPEIPPPEDKKTSFHPKEKDREFFVSLARGYRVKRESFKKSFVNVFYFCKNKFLGAGNAIYRCVKFFRFSLADYKKILSFGILAFVFVLPLQIFSFYTGLKETGGVVMSGAENAYENLTDGSAEIFDADFSSAAESFGQAAGEFSRAQSEIATINSAVASLLKLIPVGGEKFEAGEAIIFAGEKFSRAGVVILGALADFSSADKDKKFTEKIKILRNRLAAVWPDVAAASEKLEGISLGAIPEDKREIFVKLQNNLPAFSNGLRSLISTADLMVKFLGDGAEKRYLFVFQNTGEIRPTGGFIGSLALVDFNKGEIVNLEVPGGGPYDFQGSLKEKIIAPEPLQLINARWEFQDANWFPDFPASAEKIKWFYEKGGGPTVDGVIAFNSDLIEELLGVVGSIEIPEHGKVISQENFIQEIQTAVEVEYDKKENQPKKIIGDMMPKLLERVFSADQKRLGQILSVLMGALKEKNIILYSVFPEMEHEILNLGWGGQIKDVAETADYLMVVNTNLGGGKTDRVIEEKIIMNTEIGFDGSIKNRLIITRKHNGIEGELFYGVRNVDYLRVYVPAGSTLLSAVGFEAPPDELFEKPGIDYKVDPDLRLSEGRTLIDVASGTKITSEFGKTVFGNWVQVDPGEEVTVSLEYLLPFQLSFPKDEDNWFDDLRELFVQDSSEKVFYQLLVQKQSGKKVNFTSRIDFPPEWQIAWLYGQGASLGKSSISASANLETDKLYSAGFIKK